VALGPDGPGFIAIRSESSLFEVPALGPILVLALAAVAVVLRARNGR
jgi:hypothetical protein